MLKLDILKIILKEWQEKKVKNEIDFIYASRLNLQNVGDMAKKMIEIEETIKRCDVFIDIVKKEIEKENE